MIKSTPKLRSVIQQELTRQVLNNKFKPDILITELLNVINNQKNVKKAFQLLEEDSKNEK
jgi:hypothetical protein